MIDLDKKDMDAVERAFAEEEHAGKKRGKRWYVTTDSVRAIVADIGAN